MVLRNMPGQLNTVMAISDLKPVFYVYTETGRKTIQFVVRWLFSPVSD
jgi:hypothetical protein